MYSKYWIPHIMQCPFTLKLFEWKKMVIDLKSFRCTVGVPSAE